MTVPRKRLLGLAAVPLAVAGVMAMAPVAQASNSGALCNAPGTAECLRFSFNSYEQGSQTYVWAPNIPDLASYKFLTAGGGQGYSLKNNAASAANFTNQSVTIFYNSNYGGSCDTLTYYAIADKLHYTYNNDASVEFNYGRSSCYQF
jgi:hypothetical protein